MLVRLILIIHLTISLYLDFFSIFSLQFFMDINSDYSTFCHNKRAHLQRNYHYEKVILDNDILLAFYFGSSNYIHNEIYVIQEVSAGSYFYSIFHGSLIYFYNHCSLFKLIPLCSI